MEIYANEYCIHLFSMFFKVKLMGNNRDLLNKFIESENVLVTSKQLVLQYEWRFPSYNKQLTVKITLNMGYSKDGRKKKSFGKHIFFLIMRKLNFHFLRHYSFSVEEGCWFGSSNEAFLLWCYSRGPCGCPLICSCSWYWWIWADGTVTNNRFMEERRGLDLAYPA